MHCINKVVKYLTVIVLIKVNCMAINVKNIHKTKKGASIGTLFNRTTVFQVLKTIGYTQANKINFAVINIAVNFCGCFITYTGINKVFTT